MKRFSTPVALIMAAFLTTNCWFPGFESAEDEPMEDLLLVAVALPSTMEINGSWDDNFGSSHTIQGSKANALEAGTGSWNTDTTDRTILEYSNDTRTVYTRTGVPSWCTSQGTDGLSSECECFDAGTCFSRFMWTKSQDKFYYCELIYNKPTLEEAKSASAPIDDSDPANSGCDGFSWNRLDAQ